GDAGERVDRARDTRIEKPFEAPLKLAGHGSPTWIDSMHCGSHGLQRAIIGDRSSRPSSTEIVNYGANGRAGQCRVYDTTAFCMAHRAAAALVDTPILTYTCCMW